MRLSSILYLAKVSLISYCAASCSSPEKSERAYTYFGGEIVNPNTNYVVLSKDNGIHDTIPLDKNNPEVRPPIPDPTTNTSTFFFIIIKLSKKSIY